MPTYLAALTTSSLTIGLLMPIDNTMTQTSTHKQDVGSKISPVISMIEGQRIQGPLSYVEFRCIEQHGIWKGGQMK